MVFSWAPGKAQEWRRDGYLNSALSRSRVVAGGVLFTSIEDVVEVVCYVNSCLGGKKLTVPWLVCSPGFEAEWTWVVLLFLSCLLS